MSFVVCRKRADRRFVCLLSVNVATEQPNSYRTGIGIETYYGRKGKWSTANKLKDLGKKWLRWGANLYYLKGRTRKGGKGEVVMGRNLQIPPGQVFLGSLH